MLDKIFDKMSDKVFDKIHLFLPARNKTKIIEKTIRKQKTYLKNWKDNS